MRHAHQKFSVFTPTIFILLPRQVLAASDLPAAGLPHVLGGPGPVNVHLDLVDGSDVRFRLKYSALDAVNVPDGAVHVVEGELGHTADGFGGESRIVRIAGVVEPVRLALARGVGVAVEDEGVARDFDPARLGLFDDSGFGLFKEISFTLFKDDSSFTFLDNGAAG